MAPYGVDLMPAVSRLMENGIVFDNCFATAPWTGASFGSVHTGLWPRQHHCLSTKPRAGQNRQGSLLSPEAKTLAEILQDAGYHTLCAQGNPCYVGQGSGFDRGFDQFFGWQLDWRLSRFQRELQALKSAWRQGRFTAYSFYILKKILERSKLFRSAPNWPLTEGKWIIQKSSKMLQQAPQDKPVFFWINFMDMHSPYPVPGQPLPKSEAPVKIKHFHKQPRTCTDVDYALEDKICTRLLYDKAGQYVNQQIERFLAEWNRVRTKRSRLTIFISDHGEEFWDHGNQSDDPVFYHTGVEHGHTQYNELLHVPFIIHWPEIKFGRQIKEVISLIDLAPTLLDLVELKPNTFPLEGISQAPFLLSAGSAGQAERIVFAESIAYGYERQAAVNAEWKLIYCPETEQTELYAWGTSDPREKNNVADQSQFQPVREKLFAALQRWNNHIEESTLNDTAVMEDQVTKHLKALGYL